MRIDAGRKGLEEGIEKNAHDTKINLVKRLLTRKLSLEDIANICILDWDEVEKSRGGCTGRLIAKGFISLMASFKGWPSHLVAPRNSFTRPFLGACFC